MATSATSETHPLICRDLADLFIIFSNYNGSTATLTVGEFLVRARSLAEALPEVEYAINICGSRYQFMLAFCAVMMRRQTNLLPPNRNVATQSVLNGRYANCYVIHDGVELAPGLRHFDVTNVAANVATNLDSTVAKAASQVPEIPLDHLSAITFTSGSTGESKPNLKPWRTFVESSKINVRYMVPEFAETIYLLATVPGQHMWGLETSVLLPMFANICVSDARPLFPLDIQTALNKIPPPRMLVSTPVHLRALVMAGIKFPPVARVLSATAPLDQNVALQTETAFQAQLSEVYGCSEVGSMAFRYTASEDSWYLFNGINLQKNDRGTLASAAHLPESVQLQDIVEMSNERHFQLKGRDSDMVEIAGKRGSLQEVNKILLTTPGVKDGVVFFPQQEKAVGRLAAIIVLAEGTQKEDVIASFRAHLDAAFVPRPVYVVDALPREENGKLPSKRVLEFYFALKGGTQLS